MNEEGLQKVFKAGDPHMATITANVTQASDWEKMVRPDHTLHSAALQLARSPDPSLHLPLSNCHHPGLHGNLQIRWRRHPHQQCRHQLQKQTHPRRDRSRIRPRHGRQRQVHLPQHSRHRARVQIPRRRLNHQHRLHRRHATPSWSRVVQREQSRRCECGHLPLPFSHCNPESRSGGAHAQAREEIRKLNFEKAMRLTHVLRRRPKA